MDAKAAPERRRRTRRKSSIGARMLAPTPFELGQHLHIPWREASASAETDAREWARSTATTFPRDLPYAPRPMPGVFPASFLFGTATSATQIEGHCSTSDWSAFARQPGRIQHGDTPDVACDSWHRWRRGHRAPEGARDGGLPALGVEWARIEPRPGEIDHAALGEYREMLGALARRGHRADGDAAPLHAPAVARPRAGGVLAADFPARLAGFARVVVRRARGPVPLVGHRQRAERPRRARRTCSGVWPPGRRAPSPRWRAQGRLLEAHVAAYRALKDADAAATRGSASPTTSASSSPSAPRRGRTACARRCSARLQRRVRARRVRGDALRKARRRPAPPRLSGAGGQGDAGLLRRSTTTAETSSASRSRTRGRAVRLARRTAGRRARAISAGRSTPRAWARSSASGRAASGLPDVHHRERHRRRGGRRSAAASSSAPERAPPRDRRRRRRARVLPLVAPRQLRVGGGLRAALRPRARWTIATQERTPRPSAQLYAAIAKARALPETHPSLR